MATLPTHLAVGALIGAALGLRARWLPVAALLGAFADLDHFWPFETRVTFHNVFACFGVPMAIALLALRWRDRLHPEALQLLFAAPFIMSSETLLDVFPVATEVGGDAIALFWPASRTLYVATPNGGFAVDPLSPSTFTYLALGLLALALVGRLVYAAVMGRSIRVTRPAAAVAVVALLVAMPLLSSAGLVRPESEAASAALQITEAQLRIPENVLTLVVRHAGGADVPPGDVVLRVRGEGVIVDQSNRLWIDGSTPWEVRLGVNVRPDFAGPLTLEVARWRSNLSFAEADATIVRGHLAGNLTLDGFSRLANGSLWIRTNYSGEKTMPAGGLRATVTDENGTATEWVNPFSIGVGRGWNSTLAPRPGTRFTLEIASVTDGFVYLRRDALTV